MPKHMNAGANFGFKLMDALKKWYAEAYCPVFKCTKPKLYEINHAKGSKKTARFKQAMAATYFSLSKKQIPTLFQSSAELGVLIADMR